MMRELDEKSCRLQQQVDADVLQQLKAAAERQSGKPGSWWLAVGCVYAFFCVKNAAKGKLHSRVASHC